MNNTTSKEITEILIEDIIPNRFQPRLTFDVEALNELANSIKEHGIIQPLVVRKIQDKYEIIAGERRFKAASIVGLSKVPCIVMNLTDNESAEVAVIENIQRKEMTPLEEAKSFKKLLDKGYLTQDDLARKMGKSQSSIANKLRLLNLDDTVQDAILNGRISERHARSLLKIASKEEQRSILSEIMEKRLTVRQTDDLIKEKYGENTMDNNQIENQFIDSNENNNLNSNMNGNINNNMSNQMNNNIPMSTPNVNIPVHNITNDVNPQLNMMTNLGKIDENKVYEPDKELDHLEPLPNEATNPALDIFRNTSVPNQIKQEEVMPPMMSTPNENNVNINDILNPSVFSTPNNLPPEPVIEEKKAESVNVDINQIKMNAENIRQEQKPVDISSFLQSDAVTQDRKFFVDIDKPIEILDIPNERVESKSTSVISKINKDIEELRLQGNNIYKEELDLGNQYQIIIRIDK